MKKLFTILLVLFGTGQIQAQKDFLVVSKYGSSKRVYYHIGDLIQLKPVMDFPTRKGFITKLSDSAVYFSQNDSLLLSRVDYVYLGEKKGLFPKNIWMYNLISTGGIFLFYEVGNLVNGTSSPHVAAGLGVVGTVSVLPVLINLIVKAFKKNKLYIRENQWHLGTVIFPRETDAP